MKRTMNRLEEELAALMTVEARATDARKEESSRDSFTHSKIYTGCFFPRILESLPPLPRAHSAAIGCTKNYQPIGVTVYSHCVESDVGEGGVAVNCEKTQFFLNTLYLQSDS